jgi:hypothetical protein
MKRSENYWKKCFTGKVDPRVIKAIKRVYEAYPEEYMPRGICDPMYIMNVIAHELGIGDGNGNFILPDNK